MYPRGSNTYGQQSYGSQSSYGQNAGSAFSGNSAGPDGSTQHSMASRHSTLLSSSQDADIAAYRAQGSTAHYGGQYSSVYGSSSLSSGQKVPGMSAKGPGSSALESRSGYPLALPDSPKFTSNDYISSSSIGYGHKSDQLYSDKIPDYLSIERRQFGDRQSAYLGRDLQNDPSGRFADSAGFAHQHKQPDLYDRLEQASLLRQEQLLKAQSLQASSLDGGGRQPDYLAVRGAAIRNSNQELLSYAGRMDPDSRNLPMLSGSSYSGQPAPSILGAAPRRNMEDLIYAQSSPNPGYGVSLPPGRDYATGKGLHVKSLESDYPTSMLSRGGRTRIDDHKDDRGKYTRELELRDEERRRELREREREKDRQRDRDRERERERERERTRERERILERRDKERERERKHGLEARRDRTPSRVSKERRGTSLTKDSRLLRQESPRHESSQRRHSPVKEKRREYDCKVHSCSIVDVERDYLSLDKRYPRLFISPEFSKVVVNWPRENLKLSIHTSVSFEHEFVEESIADNQQSIKMAEESLKSKEGSTVWFAKMILMSGVSQRALEEISSEKNYDDRVPHICNILRFAILRKDHSFMAIGGPWDTVDGADPSVDDSSLVQTVLRYAKDVTQLDLQKCQNWNRFLEIHYDRVGKDGLFSHKEVTVLFVPDLSECLPSLDAWRNQWVAHMKTMAEHERQLSSKKEKSRERKEETKGTPKSGKAIETPKDVKGKEKSEKKKDSITSGQVVNKKAKADNELTRTSADKGSEKEKKVENKNVVDVADESANIDKKEQVEAAAASQAIASAKPKKKITKRIVTQKVTIKKNGTETTIDNQNGQLDEKNTAENKVKLETSGQDIESIANPTIVKTFIRRKASKKVEVAKNIKIEDEGSPKVKTEGESVVSEDKSLINSETNSAAVKKTPGVKTTIKKKIIKRVPKKKTAASQAGDGGTDRKTVIGEGETKEVSLSNKENTGEQTIAAEDKIKEVDKSEKKVPTPNSKTLTAKKDKKEGKVAIEEKNDLAAKVETDVKEKDPLKVNQNDKKGKNEDEEKLKATREKKETNEKDDLKTKSSNDVKEKKKIEEPPRPGFILKTKLDKDSKLRSLSLSLESLLEYSDKDLEESTFELSLFAESFYEMLQFQMGSRLLAFLQKLRSKFVTKRNQRKRQREDTLEKEKEKIASAKRAKTDELPMKHRSDQSETPDAAPQADEENAVKEEKEDPQVGDEKKNLEGESDDDEDPEEDPEEDEDMDDASPQCDSSNENEEEKVVDDSEADMVMEKEDQTKDSSKKITDEKSLDEKKLKPDDVGTSKEKENDSETKKKETSTVKEAAIDTELLQAFRFFDRNRVGYIRVEDMRLIIHSLRNHLSHRDVKELVQSALLETNTGRDDRVLYKKLVRMTDILDA